MPSTIFRSSGAWSLPKMALTVGFFDAGGAGWVSRKFTATFGAKDLSFGGLVPESLFLQVSRSALSWAFSISRKLIWSRWSGPGTLRSFPKRKPKAAKTKAVAPKMIQYHRGEKVGSM